MFDNLQHFHLDSSFLDNDNQIICSFTHSSDTYTVCLQSDCLRGGYNLYINRSRWEYEDETFSTEFGEIENRLLCPLHIWFDDRSTFGVHDIMINTDNLNNEVSRLLETHMIANEGSKEMWEQYKRSVDFAFLIAEHIKEDFLDNANEILRELNEIKTKLEATQDEAFFN